jgi:hypothetical protein
MDSRNMWGNGKCEFSLNEGNSLGSRNGVDQLLSIGNADNSGWLADVGAQTLNVSTSSHDGQHLSPDSVNYSAN